MREYLHIIWGHGPDNTCIANALSPFYSALSGMLSAYRGSRSRPSLEGASASETAEAPMTVLPSSTELFYFYAQTLEQCGRYTNGKGMKDLADVFKKWLRIFSGKSYVHLGVCSRTYTA